MEAFSKVVRIGTQPGLDSLFASIKYRDGKLSICGVEGPMRNGNALGSCGQIVMSEWNVTKYAPGWDAATVARFREVWDRWHLNDMKAGSPAQMAHLRDNPVTDRLNYFGAACESLRAAGLQPDTSYVHEGSPYSYGSAWLREEVPAEVIEFLRGLPDTDITPAWV